ncbi:MAG: hypothetical protein H6811_02070 [Phycisphaeraceae bacterium]|nr:hypothetical protein [Phycisphaeraceae bacterium]
MNEWKRRIEAWMPLTACALLLAACGGKDSEPKKSTGNTKDTSKADSPSDSGESKGVLGINDRPAASLALRSWDVGDWTVRTTWTDAEHTGQKLEIVHGGNTYRTQIGQDFSLENGLLDSQFRQGDDLTGDGRPDIVVREWSGGAQCCYTFYLLTLGDPVEELARVDADHGELSGFDDVDGDGIVEFVGNDWTWAYWKTSFAESPAPRVILRLAGSDLRLAPDLMQSPAPTQEEMEHRVERVLLSDRWTDQTPPSDLWGEALDLIYCGHEDLAWKFVVWAWPDGRPGRDAFIAELRASLDKSPYYRQLAG